MLHRFPDALLERNPWLVDPTWMLNKAEGRVAAWIFKEFGLPEKGDPGDKDRADFFCTAVGGTLHIVEIKRGAHEATEKDILQADKYRKYVVRRFKELTVPKAITYHHVQAHLISATLHKDAEGLKQVYADKGWVFFTTWDDLIERASYSHVQFRDALEIQASGITEPTIAVDEHVPSKATDRKRKKTPSSKKGGLKHIKKKKAKKAKKKKK